ncbi:hypothetical protein RV13_GL002624 [Enterococcus raffinosus]|nr:hypothetical protein RV13_GL002624 [Enterococcus raffinosus]
MLFSNVLSIVISLKKIFAGKVGNFFIFSLKVEFVFLRI